MLLDSDAPSSDTMCAWYWEYYPDECATQGEWDEQGAWSCPRCIAEGSNDPRWLGRMLGLLPDED